MLSWVCRLSTWNSADAFGYDPGVQKFPRRRDEAQDCDGDRGGHRGPRALQPAVGERWRANSKLARRRDALLPVAGWGSRVLGGWGGRAATTRARRLRRGVLLRVPQELRGAVEELQGIRPGSPGVRYVSEALAALRARGRRVAGRGLRARGDRGFRPPRGQLALCGSRRARRRAESAALREARPHMSDGLRDPRPSLRAAGGCDLRPLPRARPREHALPRHRLLVGHPLLPQEDGLPQYGSRHRRAHRGLPPHEPPARGEVLPCGLRLGQAQPRGRRPLAAGAAKHPDLLGPRSAYGPRPRSAAFRAAQPPLRATYLQGLRPPATR